MYTTQVKYGLQPAGNCKMDAGFTPNKACDVYVLELGNKAARVTSNPNPKP